MKKPPFIDWLVVLTCFSHLEKYESLFRSFARVNTTAVLASGRGDRPRKPQWAQT